MPALHLPLHISKPQVKIGLIAIDFERSFSKKGRSAIIGRTVGSFIKRQSDRRP